jgi:hypothetical protein
LITLALLKISVFLISVAFIINYIEIKHEL